MYMYIRIHIGALKIIISAIKSVAHGLYYYCIGNNRTIIINAILLIRFSIMTSINKNVDQDT